MFDALLGQAKAAKPRDTVAAALEPVAVSSGSEFAIKGRSDGVFDLHEGSISPALHGLGRVGLMARKWSKGEGRKRRVYRLTARGREAVGEQGEGRGASRPQLRR